MFEKDPVKLYFKNNRPTWILLLIFGIFAICVGSLDGLNVPPLAVGIVIFAASVYFLVKNAGTTDARKVDEFYDSLALETVAEEMEGDKVYHFEGGSMIGIKFNPLLRMDKKDKKPRSSVYQKARIILRDTELIMESHAYSIMDGLDSAENQRYHADRISECSFTERDMPCAVKPRIGGKYVPGTFRVFNVAIDGDLHISFAVSEDQADKARELQEEIESIRDRIFA